MGLLLQPSSLTEVRIWRCLQKIEKGHQRSFIFRRVSTRKKEVCPTDCSCIYVLHLNLLRSAVSVTSERITKDAVGKVRFSASLYLTRTSCLQLAATLMCASQTLFRYRNRKLNAGWTHKEQNSSAEKQPERDSWSVWQEGKCTLLHRPLGITWHGYTLHINTSAQACRRAYVCTHTVSQHCCGRLSR